jgi:hypothetical protein
MAPRERLARVWGQEAGGGEGGEGGEDAPAVCERKRLAVVGKLRREEPRGEVARRLARGVVPLRGICPELGVAPVDERVAAPKSGLSTFRRRRAVSARSGQGAPRAPRAPPRSGLRDNGSKEANGSKGATASRCGRGGPRTKRWSCGIAPPQRSGVSTRLPTDAPPPRTKWTRRVRHPVLIGHAASLSQGPQPHRRVLKNF